MSGNFLNFFVPYCCQDSITFESGYSLFAPCWKILGQLKYLEVYHNQLDCLLKNNKYSLLEEARQNWCMGTYQGRSRILSLAFDEWLELNDKEFLLYPLVRTLNGMSRQGQFIGLTQKAKCVVGTIYSAGSISERILHRSGTGSKDNCTLEKTLIGKVVCLFLCNPFDPANLGRVLKSGYMFELQLLITTKLNKKKLNTATTFIQHKDSAGVLLNGVSHT
jgi:hypothetical protein